MCVSVCVCVCLCVSVSVCVCQSNTGAVRDTEEETGLLPFELDLEKKAVFPSCQISLTAMPLSSSRHKLVWWKPRAVHLFTESFHTNSKVFITHSSEITSVTAIISSELYWSQSLFWELVLFSCISFLLCEVADSPGEHCKFVTNTCPKIFSSGRQLQGGSVHFTLYHSVCIRWTWGSCVCVCVSRPPEIQHWFKVRAFFFLLWVSVLTL